MNIIFLSNVYPSPIHPTKGVFNREMIRSVNKCGHDVSVICPIAWTDCVQAKTNGRRDGRSSHKQNGINISYPTYLFTPKLLRNAYGWFMWRSIRATARRELKRFQPDAIVGYWAHPDGHCVVKAAREAGVPSIVMVGGSDILLLTNSRHRKQNILRVLNNADAIVTVSEDIRGKIIRFGVKAEKVHLVRRGINKEHFHTGCKLSSRTKIHLAPNRPTLLWVGRMTPVKGLPILIEAVDILRKQISDVAVYLIGSGEKKNAIEQEIVRRGIEANVRMMGPVAHEALADWYRAADLTVLPSYSEGVPNVLLESIACGTPFVASEVGGIPEIATKGVDTLTPTGDAQSLATAISDQLLGSRDDSVKRSFQPSSLSEAAQQLTDVIAQAKRAS